MEIELAAEIEEAARQDGSPGTAGGRMEKPAALRWMAAEVVGSTAAPAKKTRTARASAAVGMKGRELRGDRGRKAGAESRRETAAAAERMKTAAGG